MLIIGCGASGMFAALTAAKLGVKVTVLEKNEKAGKKLYITGKGRCNITNNSTIENYLNNIPVNPRFIMSALNAFGPQDTIAFFEENGVPVITERGNRVFPASNKSSDIIGAMNALMKRYDVEIVFGVNVKELKRVDYGFEAITDKGIYVGKTAILATGGVSYRATGSTGDGYRFAKEFGHTVIEPKGALVGVLADNTAELAGLTLKNVTASIVLEGKTLASEFGELLFTHIGLSGPVILTLSSHVNKYDAKLLTVAIDLKPALDAVMLDKRLLRDFSENINRKLSNSLGDLLPKALIPEVIKQSGLSGEETVNQITKEQRASIVATLKALKFPLKGFDDINNAIITSGGVNVKEINPKTMESKIVNGLFFAGEVIDVDALTGGYNLQIALSTGYAAAKSAAEKELQEVKND